MFPGQADLIWRDRQAQVEAIDRQAWKFQIGGEMALPQPPRRPERGITRQLRRLLRRSSGAARE